MTAPQELIRATVLYVNDHNPLPMRSAVDRFVTSARGYLTLANAGYRRADGTLDVTSLADALAAGTARQYNRNDDDDEIVRRAKIVAERAVAVATAIALPGGSDRAAALKQAEPIERGRPLFRPINVGVSEHPQHDEVIDVDGPVRVRFIDVARDGHEHVVLLIHGHASRLEEYDALVNVLLKAKCRVIVCDLPGCGYSDHPEREYNLEWYERVLLAMLDKRGVKKNCVAAGGSLGGNLSLRLGLRAPDRFSHVVSWAPAGWWKTKPAASNLANALNEHSFYLSYRIQAQSWYAKTNPKRDEMIERAVQYANEVFSPGFLRAYAAMASEQIGTSMFERAKDITVPTFLLVAKGDASLDMHNGVVALSKRIPGAKLHEYEGGHSIADEHTEDLASRLIAFVSA